MRRKIHKHLKAIINLYYAYVISYLTEDTVSLQYKCQSINAVMEITPIRKNRAKQINILYGKNSVLSILKVAVKDYKSGGKRL
jgi:hypothetical protein